MKKALSLFLALVMCLSLCSSLTACSAKDKYVGVWKYANKNVYMYIYEDGTGDFLGLWGDHYDPFIWQIEGDYLVRYSNNSSSDTVIKKYTLENNCLLNSRKEIVFCKHSEDTSIDVNK